MFKKYMGVSDEDLVLRIKKGDFDAETEMFERYKKLAEIIARSIYRDFKSQTYLELEDCVNCALLSVSRATRKFDQKSKFKTYWSIVARNDVMKLIKDSSEGYRYGFNNTTIPLSDDEMMYFASPNDEYEDETIEILIRNLHHHYPGISKKDLMIMKKYLYGFSSYEIADQYHLSYTTVHKKVNAMKIKIAKLLLHS
ncbi:MAG: sigma-70 family RNA polymerase sigma factor [Bacilli bacterium]|nr:sigma-70 family RNA polymerase sigma factor [Bacilli bacterium]